MTNVHREHDKAETRPDAPGLSPPEPTVWLDRHGDALFRYALSRMRDRDVAEELVQETFLAGLRGWEQFSGQSDVQTWLISILRRKIVDHFRGKRLPLTDTTDEVERFAAEFFDQRGVWHNPLPKWRAGADATFREREFWDVFDDCVSSLPETVSGAFSLREMEQMDSEEVCKILEISPSNLWARLHRARMFLRRCLESNWFARSD
ncbi:MAG: sigma-70 family RNA polymerase sigma factor [Phycisphaerae bacterium]